MNTRSITAIGRNAGFVMPITLMFLLILLVITISMFSSNILQERMVSNAKDSNLAFQAAEAGLHDAENDIIKNISPASGFDTTCNNGLCQPGTPPVWTTVDWSDSDKIRTFGQYTAGATPPQHVANKPIYIIEKLPTMDTPPGEDVSLGLGTPKVTYMAYRVTVRATGARAETNVMLQSIFYRPNYN